MRHPFRQLAGGLLLLLLGLFTLHYIWLTIAPMLPYLIALLVFVLVVSAIRHFY